MACSPSHDEAAPDGGPARAGPRSRRRDARRLAVHGHLPPVPAGGRRGDPGDRRQAPAWLRDARARDLRSGPDGRRDRRPWRATRSGGRHRDRRLRVDRPPHLPDRRSAGREQDRDARHPDSVLHLRPGEAGGRLLARVGRRAGADGLRSRPGHDGGGSREPPWPECSRAEPATGRYTAAAPTRVRSRKPRRPASSAPEATSYRLMLGLVAAAVFILGGFALAWGISLLVDPPELGYWLGLVLVIFGVAALYSGASVLRSGRL